MYINIFKGLTTSGEWNYLFRNNGMSMIKYPCKCDTKQWCREVSRAIFSENWHRKQEHLEAGAWLSWEECFHTLVRKRGCKMERQLQPPHCQIYLSTLIRKATQENHCMGNLRDSLHSLFQVFSHIKWGILSNTQIFIQNAFIYELNCSSPVTEN